MTVFFKGTVPGRSTMLLWKTPHPGACEQYTLDTVRYKTHTYMESGVSAYGRCGR